MSGRLEAGKQWLKGKLSRSSLGAGRSKRRSLDIAASVNANSDYSSEALVGLNPAANHADDTTNTPQTISIPAISVDDWDQKAGAGNSTLTAPTVSSTGVSGATPGEPNVVNGGEAITSGVLTTSVRNDAFVMAFEKFTQGLTQEERNAFHLGNNISPEKLLADVKDFDDQHSLTSSSRKCVAKVKGFLDTLSVYLNALAIAIQYKPAISFLVVGGIRLIVDLGRQFADFFGQLTDMIGSFGDHLYYLSENAKIHGHHEKVKEALCAVYGDLLEFCKKARGVFTDPGGDLDRSASAKVAIGLRASFQSDMAAIKLRFNERAEIVTRIVTIEEQKRVHARELSEEVEKGDRERGEVLSWLPDLRFDDDHERIYSKRHGNTGNWFLESEPFGEWLDAKESCLLWCHGNPGAGKSVITSIVLDQARAKHSLDENVGIGFVYFNHQSQEAQEPAEVLSTLIKQLCRQRKGLPDQVKQLYKQYQSQSQRPSLETLKALFLEVTCTFNHAFIIVDAMDECKQEHRTHILSCLVKLSRESRGRFKIFVASRNEKDIEIQFKSRDCLTIHIEAKKVDADIASFVHDWIHSRQDEQNMFPISQTLKSKIENALTSQSSGMFLWVQCQLDYIYQQPSAEDIEEALDSLPNDLNAMYFQILRRIDKQVPRTKHIAKHALAWVFTAGRPLSIEELVTAVAIEPTSKSIGKLKQYTGKTIIDACCNLLAIDDSGTVRPVHYTVKEFFTMPALVADQSSSQLIEEYRVAQEGANSELARSCVQYILFEAPRQARLLDEDRFFRYACNFWDFHLRGLQSFSGDLSAVLQTFLSSAAIPRLYEVRHGRGNFIIGEVNALNMCLTLDLLPLYLKFHKLSTSLSPEQRSADAMCNAAAGGSVTSITTLLELGYTVNAADNDGAHPLYYAAMRGHEEAVEFLIDRGACVNASGGNLGSALQTAVSKGHEKIVRTLLRSGADVDAEGGKYGNALRAAASKGNEKMVQILLEGGADVNSQGGGYGNALQAAASNGHENIVRILLNGGARVNAQGGKYGNTLRAAVLEGRETIVQILLESGADVNAEGWGYENALQAAASGGEETIVQILLDNGADVNAQGGHHGNALQAAASKGHEQVVRILLKRGADVNAPGTKYGNALWAAASRGQELVVQILLDNGADVNVGGGVYGNPLQVATAQGQEKIVQILLESGADVNAGGGDDGNALQAAAQEGNEEIIQILLDNGADVNARGGYHGNALQAAASKGHESVVQILLERGAHVNLQGGVDGSALQAAAREGNETIVQVLLENGANVNARGGYYGNALQAAVSMERERVIQMLLECGADPIAQEGNYDNSLEAGRGNNEIAYLPQQNEATEA